MIEDSKSEGDIHESLRNDEWGGGVQLEMEKRTFEPKWKIDTGGYLRGVRGCGSSATETCEKRREKELEKSAFHRVNHENVYGATKPEEIASYSTFVYFYVTTFST